MTAQKKLAPQRKVVVVWAVTNKRGKPVQVFTTKSDAQSWRCPGVDESIVRCVGEVMV